MGIVEWLLALLGGVSLVAGGLWLLLKYFLFPIVSALTAVLAALLLIAVVRTLLRGHKVSAYVPTPDGEKEVLCAEKLSAMVQCETVSYPGVSDPDKFRRFHRVMRELYPRVFKTVK